jgi:metal-responsive CopG/Arc/MetJ family transcriptional regulator
MASSTIRTTVTLPADLLEAADQAVREGKARNRNELLATALRKELAEQRRAALDAAFAEMANDAEYQAETRTIGREFARADWEAWQLAESEP